MGAPRVHTDRIGTTPWRGYRRSRRYCVQVPIPKGRRRSLTPYRATPTGLRPPPTTPHGGGGQPAARLAYPSPDTAPENPDRKPRRAPPEGAPEFNSPARHAPRSYAREWAIRSPALALTRSRQTQTPGVRLQSRMCPAGAEPQLPPSQVTATPINPLPTKGPQQGLGGCMPWARIAQSTRLTGICDRETHN